MHHVMIDLETMSTRGDAAIVSIGAIFFDPRRAELGPGLHLAVDLRSAQAMGGHVDADTVLWWLRQSDAARAAITSREALPIDVALDELTGWLRTHSDDGLDVLQPWGNGADFDLGILSAAYRKVVGGRSPTPWRYYNQRCFRTLRGLRTDLPMVREGVHHNALSDATTQARHACRILQAMDAGRLAADMMALTPAQGAACATA
jgi:exodeoxyribonuclease VIII